MEAYSNRPWRPIGLWDVQAPTFFYKWVHRLRWDCQPHVPATLYSQGRFLVLISVRDWVDPRTIERLEGLGQSINPMTLSGMKPVTCRFVVCTKINILQTSSCEIMTKAYIYLNLFIHGLFNDAVSCSRYIMVIMNSFQMYYLRGW
jgi:hypothetical protein